MRSVFLWVFAALVLAAAAPASADWSRASSEHFVIYSEKDPDSLRQFAEKLERFDAAVRLVRGMSDLPPSLGNRVSIFELGSASDVQKLLDDRTGFVAGYYEGRASGSVAFVSRNNSRPRETSTGSNIKESNAFEIDDDTILLHEYSHHLMMQDLSTPYPEWLVEGFAEFMSTAEFESDGSVGIGLPAKHRYIGLLNWEQLPLTTLLSGDYDKITVEQRESVYGQGWLLTHYLTFEPSRKGQLNSYVASLARGVAPLDAARQAFGDLGTLEHDVRAYLDRSKLDFVKISGNALKIEPIHVARLSKGASDAVPVLIQIKSDVPQNRREAVANKARSVESANPGDPFVETVLAEAELDAKNFTAAEAAADRAAKADPRSTDAMILKGRAIAGRAASEKGPSRHTLFEQARNIYIAANKLDSEDPEPLMDFYLAFVSEGIPPTTNAIAALHYASDLAPQDLGLRMNSAMAYINEGKLKDARATLTPVAYSPHGGQVSDIARQMIGKIDTGAPSQDILAIATAAPKKPSN